LTDAPAPVVPAYRNPDTTPFIYFDIVPTFGVMEGAIQIELAARTISPDGAGTKLDFICTAHLRCSPVAALALRDAITKAVDMLQQPQEGSPDKTAMN
jgi:hypothetical protein